MTPIIKIPSVPKCPTCPIAVSCMKRNNPPKVCMIPPGAMTQAGYWVGISRMGKQEHQLRMNACEGGD